MRGLIIKPYWLDLILSGKKKIEVRGFIPKNYFCEKFYLIESGGMVRGTARISASFYFSNEAEWEEYKHITCLDISYEDLLKKYSKPCGWLLENVERIEPFEYKKRPGAVIWIKEVERRDAQRNGF